MNWYSGRLEQVNKGGWDTLNAWHSVSLQEAHEIVEAIRAKFPDSHFTYTPYPTAM
jgi:hypothetical protein